MCQVHVSWEYILIKHSRLAQAGNAVVISSKLFPGQGDLFLLKCMQPLFFINSCLQYVQRRKSTFHSENEKQL